MAWYNLNYLWKKQISIDYTKVGGSSDLSSFPVLISFTDTDLRTTSNSGKVQNSSGFDIIFTDSTETTKLDHEIESYSASSGAIIMWVRIPTLSHTANTVIYVYFGNSSISSSQENIHAVWDSNYKAVLHLGNGTTLSAVDSTSNANNGTISGATATTGQIDGGAAFVAASHQKITYAGIALTAPYTLESWLYPQSGSNVYATILAQADVKGLWWAGGAASHRVDFYYATDHYCNSTLTLNTWYYIAVTVDVSGNVSWFINGAADGTNTGAPTSLTITTSGSDPSNEDLNGNLDELRVSSGIARSSGWIATCYNNQNSPSSFYSVGSLVGKPGVAFISNTPCTIVAGTLSVEQTIGKRAQASFLIYHAGIDLHIQQYQAVAIYDQLSNLAFTGYVATPKEAKPGFQNSLLTQITCTDQHRIADKRRIAKVYTGYTRASIVQDILATILAQEGVTLGAIIPEDANVATLYPSTSQYPSTALYPQGSSAGLINATFIYAKVSEALDALTKDANQSGIPYYWAIDKHKRLYWVPYTYTTSTLVVDGTSIDQVNSVPALTRANPLYMNKLYVLGGVEQTSVQTEIQTGDGSKRAWAMGYPLAKAPLVYTNVASGGYVAKTVGVKGIDTGKAFYWSQNDVTITQASDQAVLGTGDLVKVVYTGQYPVTTTAEDDAQISLQASLDLTSGIVEDVEIDSSLTTAADGKARATGLIARNAVQGMLFEFQTLDSSFAPGQMRTFNYAPHGLNSQQMLIEKVTASDQQDSFNIWYQISAISGPYDQTWQDFFSELISSQEKSQAISAGLQGIIALSQQFSAAISLASSMTVTVSTLVGFYGTNVLSSDLTTASKLATSGGGTETGITTVVSGGNSVGEITSQGVANTAVSSIPATPTGRGWAYRPGSSTIQAGNWSASVTLAFADWQSGNTLTLRFFKYSGGSYTSIGTIVASVTSNAKTTYNFAATSFSSMAFGSSDLLYVDLWLTDASGAGGDNPTVYLGTSASAGVANDLQIITPGF